VQAQQEQEEAVDDGQEEDLEGFEEEVEEQADAEAAIEEEVEELEEEMAAEVQEEAQEEEEVAEEEEEEDEVGQEEGQDWEAGEWVWNWDARHVGVVKSSNGKRQYTIYNPDILEAFGSDAKVSWKSNAPTINVGDWVTFSIAQEYDEWGAPLAVDLAPEEPPEGADALAAEVCQWPAMALGRNGATKADGGVSGSGGLAKSGAVALFRQARTVGVSPKGLAKGGLCNGPKGAAQASRPTKPAKLVDFQRVFLEPPASMNAADRKAMQSMREELEIGIDGGDGCDFPPVVAFEELAGVVPDYALQALTGQGIEAPMPIQAQSLPLVLAGNDLIGIAKTGSGKTLAYLLPAIVHIEAQEPLQRGAPTPIALILAPVRELAVQIAEEAQKVCQGSTAENHPQGIGSTCVYGGGASNKGWQIAALRKAAHIVAATPGRLVDLLSSRDLSLERVTYFVLDEADRMLECGFEDQVGAIASQVRPDRQTLFFSATWPWEVQQLAQKMCHEESRPVHVRVGQKEDGSGPTTRQDIIQEVVVFDEPTWEERDHNKQELLYMHLREVLASPAHKALVFVSRKTLADELCNRLWSEGFATHSMHGGRSQDSRLDILEGFKTGDTKLLVCTDVMSRGLDIPGISHVVIYDMGDIEDYVHRIGRTARGPYGEGHALTFFEYDRKWPQLAGELLEVLQASEQDVPEDLTWIAQEVAAGGGRREGARWGASPWG